MKVDYEIVEKLGEIPTGNLCDALGKKNNMRHDLKPIYSGARVWGTAVTVRCPVADNLTIHKAMETAGEGDVLVVNAGDYKNAGLFGEVMAVSCQAKGIAGAIIDGGCRDAKEMAEMKFPVFSSAINPGGTVKESLGDVNVPIQCGGVAVNPGDIIVGDDDGVVSIPPERAEEVLEKAQGIIEKEERFFVDLKKGKDTMEVLGFNEILKKKGLL